jgi:hypothetical protein
MKTFYAADIREKAEQLSAALGVEVAIGPRHMYGNENNYSLSIGGVEVFASGSTDAIGGFLTALEWLDPEVVADVFFRQEEDTSLGTVVRVLEDGSTVVDLVKES